MFDRRLLLKGGLAATALGAMPLRAHETKLKNAPFPIYDTHPHFYTSDTASYPFKPDITPRGSDPATNNPMTPEVIFDYWDQAGILMGTAVQYNTVYGTDNSYTLDVSAAHPGRILPVVILSATDPATPDTLRRMTHENGIAGVRLFGSPINGEFAFFTEEAKPAWDAIAELGIVAILMLVGGDLNRTMGRVHEFAMRYPNVNIVLDHLGYTNPDNSPETYGLTPNHFAVAPHRNLYWKLTSFHITTQIDRTGSDLKGFFEFVAELYGADRMMWGSDIGNTHGTTEYHLGLLQRAIDATEDMAYAERKAIFFDTPHRLFVPGGRVTA